MTRTTLLLPCASCALSSLLFGSAACGNKGKAVAVDAAAPSASVVATAAPVTTSAPTSTPDPERDQAVTRACTNKCERECITEQRDKKEFFEQKRAQIEKAPFEVKVDRVWLKGSCHHGDVPEKRDDTDGITAIVEGKITYKGDDTLFGTELQGYAYLDTGDHVASVAALEKAYSAWTGTKYLTKIVRRARGSDPWRKGQQREFHWESEAFSEAFCEAKPKSAGVLLEMRTWGVKNGTLKHAIGHAPLAWDEVVGMATKEHVTVKRGENALEESVDATFTRLDKVFITSAAGKSEWMARTSITQGGFFARASAPVMPQVIESPLWTVKISSVTGEARAGEWAPTGEDQAIVVVDVELQSKASEGKPTKAKAFGFQLETTPGTWAGPIAKAPGQLDGATDIAPGDKATGKVMFLRQRFERPFRIKVTTPDRQTIMADVFNYELGPESWK